MLDQVNVGMGIDLLQQRTHDLSAGEVLAVEDAPGGVTALPVQGVLRGVFVQAVEVHPERDQLLDRTAGVAGGDVDHLTSAESSPGDQRVADVVFPGVILQPGRGDAPLCPAGVALDALALGEDGHLAVGGRLEGKQQTSEAASDDDDV